MVVLGVSKNHFRADEDYKRGPIQHDSAAALVVDGELVAAIEQERLDRIKHSNAFPAAAMGACLDIAGLTWSDVNIVCVSVAEEVADLEAVYRFLVEDPARSFHDGRKDFSTLFDRAVGVDVTSRLRFCHHHLAHGWSAFGMSGQKRGLVAVFDGEGDGLSTSMWIGEANSLTRLDSRDSSRSLGGFYVNVIRLLGYTMFDEYKVMGLAPYGDPCRYWPVFERCFTLNNDGTYDMAPVMEQIRLFESEGLVSKARRTGAPFTQEHKDIAAGLQTALERMILHTLRHYRQVTGTRCLAIAGGVAQNCSANGRVLLEGIFDEVFVPPAAHDSGTALGAALYVSAAEDRTARTSMRHCFLGKHIGTQDEIRTSLARWSDLITLQEMDDIAAHAASLLAGGEVLGWVQGRSEFGARALGNRSILADPRPAENKRVINQMIKKREAYRPFAPAVLQERAREFFILPENQAGLPFMTFAVPVKSNVRSLLGAVTHVDGTARIQTVSKGTNQQFWSVIYEFGRLTGIPILLNTSFNNNAEPIVDSVDDAVSCLLTTGLRRIVIGRFVVSKNAPEDNTSLGGLTVVLPPQRKLVRRFALDEFDHGLRARYEIESTRSKEFGRPVVEISQPMFDALSRADDEISFYELLGSDQLKDSATVAKLLCELRELWSERIVLLRPTSRAPYV